MSRTLAISLFSVLPRIGKADVIVHLNAGNCLGIRQQILKTQVAVLQHVDLLIITVIAASIKASRCRALTACERLCVYADACVGAVAIFLSIAMSFSIKYCAIIVHADLRRMSLKPATLIIAG